MDSLNEFFDARDDHSVATATASVENSYATAQRTEDRSQRTEDRSVTVTSVTAAEPIEDDQDDNSYYNKHVATIRLSSLGCAMERDVGAVQCEFGNGISTDEDDGSTEAHFSDEFTNNSGDENYALQKKESKSHGNDSNPVTPSGSSEEITVEDHPSDSQPQRHRLVSDDGVIAEYDINAEPGTYNDNEADEVMVQAVEIDSSFHDVSFRSEMEDLEMGDTEPLPYPGRRGHSASNSANRNATDNLNSTASRRSSAGMYGRAELLSATVIKNSPTEQIGINLMRDDTVVYSINRGEEDEGSCLLRHCPFQAGDRVLSINNKRTNHMDSAEAARILREASGFVTIVCHNHGGDPCLIETMITKANKNQRSGMGLKSTGSRDLRVSSINENGLFAQSLLNVGDRILTINEVDVTEVDARVACDIIKNSPDRVTVLARQSHSTAVVVAEVSNRGLRQDHTDFPLETVHEAGAAVDPNEIEAVDDAFQLSKQQREQLLVAFCIALVLVGIMSGIFGRPSS